MRLTQHKRECRQRVKIKSMTWIHYLLPTAIITIPKSDPQVVTSVMKVLKSANERLLLIGAKIENNVMNLDEINQFKTLPTKESLQGQLVGLLTMAGGAGLVRTLETPGKVLYLNLDQRKKDMEGPKQEEKQKTKSRLCK